MKIFSENLKTFRKELHLSQKKLATKLKYTEKTINYWEQGKSEPSLSAIINLCKFFDITPNDLIGPVTQCIYRQEDKCTESEESPP